MVCVFLGYTPCRLPCIGYVLCRKLRQLQQSAAIFMDTFSSSTSGCHFLGLFVLRILDTYIPPKCWHRYFVCSLSVTLFFSYFFLLGFSHASTPSVCVLEQRVSSLALALRFAFWYFRSASVISYRVIIPLCTPHRSIVQSHRRHPRSSTPGLFYPTLS
jgi:hypothetical protein